MMSSHSTTPRGATDVTASLVHELKNPLAAVKALVQLVLSGPLDERTRRRLDVVQTEIAHMEAILRDQTVRRPAVDVEPVELGALADDVLAVLEARAATAGVALGRHPATATIAGDRARLRSALLNLVGNAIEATPAGGRVDLRVWQWFGHVHVEIRDTGKGIAAEDLARLGTPFFTRREDGTGLGILLARSVVAAHGGTLEYDSQVGRGTVAHVTLPVESDAAAVRSRGCCS